MSNTPRKIKAHGHIIQADWNQTDPLQMDYIHNKPEIPSIEGLVSENYVDNKTSLYYPLDSNSLEIPMSTIIQSIPDNSLIEIFGSCAVFYDEINAGTGNVWYNVGTNDGGKIDILKINNIYYITIFDAIAIVGSPTITNGNYKAIVENWTSGLWFMPPITKGGYRVTPIITKIM